MATSRKKQLQGKIAKLQVQRSQRDRERRKIEDAIDDQVRAFERQLNSEREPEFDAIRESIDQIDAEIQQIQTEIDAINVAAVTAKDKRIGRRAYEETLARFSREMIRTGRVAVFEVFKPGDKTREKYCGPSVGDVVLRILKKDGTPSVDVVRAFGPPNEDGLPRGWRFEES